MARSLQFDVSGGTQLSTSSLPSITAPDTAEAIGGAVGAVLPAAQSVMKGYAMGRTSAELKDEQGDIMSRMQQDQARIQGVQQQLSKASANYMSSRSPAAGAEVNRLQSELNRIQRGADAGRLTASGAKAMIDNVVAGAVAKYPWAKAEIKVMADGFAEGGQLANILEQAEFSQEQAEASHDELRKEMLKHGLDVNSATDVNTFKSQARKAYFSDLALKDIDDRIKTTEGKATLNSYELDRATTAHVTTAANSAFAQVNAMEGATPDQKVAVLKRAQTDAINQYLARATEIGTSQEKRSAMRKQIEDQFGGLEEMIKANDPLELRKRQVDIAETNRKWGIEENFGSHLVMKDLGLTSMYTNTVNTIMEAAASKDPEKQRFAAQLVEAYGIDLDDPNGISKALIKYAQTGQINGNVMAAGLIYSHSGAVAEDGTIKHEAAGAMEAAATPQQIENMKQNGVALETMVGVNYSKAVVGGGIKKESFQNSYMNQVNLFMDNLPSKDWTTKMGDNGLIVVDPSGNEYITWGSPDEGGGLNSLLDAVRDAGGNPQMIHAGGNMNQTVTKLNAIAQRHSKDVDSWLGDAYTNKDYKYNPTLTQSFTKWVGGLFGGEDQPTVKSSYGAKPRDQVDKEQHTFNQNVNKYAGGRGSKYIPIYQEAAAKYNLDPNILIRMGAQESGYWDEKIISGKRKSSAGAVGIGQFMPATAKRFGVNRIDVRSSIEGQAKYMRFLLDRFNGDYAKAVAGYNAGEGAVDKYGGVPPYKETQKYVKRIVGGYSAN